MSCPDSSIHFLIPIAGFLINVFVQLLSVRAITGLGVLRSILAGFTVGGLCVLSAELYLSSNETVPMIILNLIIYGALGYCYFHFINLGITARRIKILRELHLSGSGLTLQEILLRYNAKDMINTRLDRLLNSGQIVLTDNKYHIDKPVMLFMSKTIVAMKLIVLGKKSEFE